MRLPFKNLCRSEMRIVMLKKIEKLFHITDYIGKNHIGAYAAQAAYFLMLSMIPIFLLLLTVIQYTPVTKADVMSAMVLVFPSESMRSFVISIINEVYNQSRAVIPITIVMTFWSAGKGVMAINAGLNCVYNTKETRNYVILRLRACFYTVVFILAIVLGLVFSVFGNNISVFINSHFPFLRDSIGMILESRTVVSFALWFLFAMVVYHFLPNRKTKLRKHIPGAVFSAIAWMLISFGFSAYVTIFKGFSGLYGSMTAIILVMLWLYFCMYAMLLGGLLNSILVSKR